jgi:hypothetical protein
MLTVRRILVLPFVLLAIVSTSAFAGQQHVVAPDQLASTVSAQVASQDADRAAVHEALARPEVRDVVSSMGVDLDTVAAVVDTLTGTQLAQAGDAARQVNQQLVGGASTVVISTTAIILILLLVIILILALK